MLYLVATPIGNIKDFSFRAVEVLKSCDYILCEDTRHSRVLLEEYGIQKPLKSFHLFNERGREDAVLDDLRAGKEIGLISDAGTPGICDPGEVLVSKCREAGLAVTAVPGPCAWVVALSLSSFPKERVQFLGFLPRQDSLLKKKVVDILFYPGTSIFYESPHRLVEILERLAKIDSACKVEVFRELTKKFEECLEAPLQEMIGHFKAKPPKGEFVVLIEGREIDYTAYSIQEQVQELQDLYGLPLSEAIKVCAELRDVPKRDIYNQFHQE